MHRCLLPFLLMIVLSLSLAALADIGPTMQFLLLPPSAEANGRAGVYTSLGNDDPLSILINPAAMGFVAEHSMVSAGFYPSRANLYPHSVDYDFPEYTPRAYSTAKAYTIGFNSRQVSAWAGHRVPLSIGIGYQELRENIGNNMYLQDGFGDYRLATNLREASRGLTFGLGLDYYVKAAVGLNHKFLNSDIKTETYREWLDETDSTRHSAEVQAIDTGFLLEIPFLDITRKITHRNLDVLPGLRPDLAATFGYALLNKGDAVHYDPVIIPHHGNPLPRTARANFSLRVGLLSVSGEQEPWRMLSFEWASMANSSLVRMNPDSSFYYRSGMGDIGYYHNLILGRSNNRIDKMKGWELDFLEIVSVRGGTYEMPDGASYRTRGFGIQTAGVFKLIRGANPSLDYLSRHFDVQYHRSTVSEGQGAYNLDGVMFEQVSLSIR